MVGNQCTIPEWPAFRILQEAGDKKRLLIYGPDPDGMSVQPGVTRERDVKGDATLY